MTAKEQVWRHVLAESRERGRAEFRQKDVAGELGLSVSTVHAALEVPRRAGAVEVWGRGFRLVDWRKLLTVWAVFRNLEKDVVWEARLRYPADRVEGDMVPQARFSGASAFKFRYGYAPADYDEVLVYLEEEHLPELEGRFRVHIRPAGETLLRVLRPDPRLPRRVPPEQVYVDLWQSHPWWTAEFLRYLEEELGKERAGR
ncbi:hypothetical protein DXX99_07930 [Ammonifex thiophilus]|uniref:Uncharacterized protein n=2 Tax=Ammonifex thiophilus TaxID=444093 RepID=A0A3D8P4J0_9THEO|nr:hypothetical protein DXX99_07930 [Ammonifex thiophilus]